MIRKQNPGYDCAARSSGESPLCDRRVRHRIHGNPFHVRNPPQLESVEALFGRKAPIAVDVGFGKGEFTLDLAHAFPEWNVVGLEIRSHLVERLDELAGERALPNVKGLKANASAHWSAIFPPRSVCLVAVNFPDPCFRRKHQKRRVWQRPWVEELLPTLAPGAELCLRTDFEPLASQVQKVMSSWPGFEYFEYIQGRVLAITTHREQRHLGRGDSVFRLCYRWRSL